MFDEEDEASELCSDFPVKNQPSASEKKEKVVTQLGQNKRPDYGQFL
jgi:hypothetical protein